MRRILLFVLVFSVVACTEKPPRHIDFYHWQSNFQPTETEQEYLQALGSQKIYLRFFDVKVKQGQAYPEAVLQSDTYYKEYELIPTVYITNAALLATAESELGQLAENLLKKCATLWQQELGQEGRIKKLQLDCDWTPQTGSKFFRLLELLKEKGALQEISSTLRLHQVKFRETAGVPPVDRVVLMFYNMGKLDDPEEENSILNLDIGQQYLARLRDYPLPMDVALPIFQWGVQIRAGRVIQLLNNFNPTEGLEKGILEKLGPNHYEVAQSGYLAGTYLYSGDRIRHERVSVEKLEQAVDLLEEAQPEPFNLVLYHLDEKLLEQYPLPQLEETLMP